MQKVSRLLLVLCVGLGMVACSSAPGNAPVASDNPGSVRHELDAKMQQGVVTGVKEVVVLGKRTGVGRTVGRTVGSIAGGAIGSGYGSIAGSILGSVLGGMAGSNADRSLQRKPGLEITVRLEDGQHVTVTQLKGEETFKEGDKVKLVMKNGKAHVTHH